LEEDASQLDHDFRVVWKKFSSMLELDDSSIDILLRSHDGPAEAELNVANQLGVTHLNLNNPESLVVFKARLHELSLLVEALAAQQMQKILVAIFDLVFDDLKSLESLIKLT
jgi:hypothetical protein